MCPSFAAVSELDVFESLALSLRMKPLRVEVHLVEGPEHT